VEDIFGFYFFDPIDMIDRISTLSFIIFY